ncbi:MAG TPA: GTP-binding protein [Ktedonobacterales bacterium]
MAAKADIDAEILDATIEDAKVSKGKVVGGKIKGGKLVAARVRRERISPRNLLKVSTLTKLPSNVATARRFISAVNWNAAQEEVKGELDHKVAILGMANSGKSTLFNTLRGSYSSPVSPEAGTTTTLVRGDFGPFTLIDTPGHVVDLQESAYDESAAVIYLLDATQGIRGQDYALITKLRGSEKPLVVALNKSDMLGANADEVCAEAAARLHVQDVIPISARDGMNVADELIPAIIDTSPDAALTLGRALPAFRREAAQKLVRTATLVSLAAGLEPIPLVDIPILLGNQIRLVLRIAAVYDEPLSAKYARELVLTIAGGLAMRYIAEEAAKAVPIAGDLVSGAIAAAGTWTLGQVAIEYFEGGKKISRVQVNEMFTRFYTQFRERGANSPLLADRARVRRIAAPRSQG